MRETNCGGNLTYRASALHRPSTLEQLRELVAVAPQLRVLGSRHSFNEIAEADQLVSLDGLPAGVVIDRAAATVALNPAVRYGALAETLNTEGLALHNLASLPHISVGGAVATATHGSGDANGSLASAVAGLELLTSSGELVRARRGDPDFEGMVVGLGALGAVTRIALDVQPACEIRQRVFEGLARDALLEHHAEIAALGHSVSVFTRWGPDVDMVWIKSRVTDSAGHVRDDLFGPRPSTATRSSASTPSTARGSWGGRGCGRTVCRTSAWASRPASGTSCSPSSCSRAAPRSGRSRRSARSRPRSRPGRRSPRCARSRPTTCG